MSLKNPEIWVQVRFTKYHLDINFLKNLYYQAVELLQGCLV